MIVNLKGSITALNGRSIKIAIILINNNKVKERIPYQPKLRGPILLCAELIINSSNDIK